MSGPGPSRADVRMRGFLERLHPDQALARLRPLLATLASEAVPLDEALGRTLAEEVVSAVDVPDFRKAAVDGYAVVAEDTFGAAPSSPAHFALVGSVLPGRPVAAAVGRGRAARIMTGAPVPDSADAVVMAEHVDDEGERIRVTAAVTPGANVVEVGEDVRRGQVLLAPGRVLRPADLGLLASVGASRPRLARRPRVAIAATGSELVGSGDAGPRPAASVVNSNGPVVAGLVRLAGGEPIPLGIVADDRAAVRRLLEGFPGDCLVTTGGTSVGVEDYLPVVLAEVGELLVHGLNIRPGSPSGFGRVGARPVFLLPGNPVAAMVGFDVLVRPALQWLLGQVEGRRNPRRRGRLTRKVASALNRADFVRVEVRGEEVIPLRSGGAGVLSSMSRADGFVIVPKDREGYDAGAEVEVYLFE